LNKTAFKLVTTGALVLCAVVAALPAWTDIAFLVWKDEEQSHIWLAIPVAIWLGWMRRKRLRRVEPDYAWLGPIAAVGCIVLARVGFGGGFDLFWHAAAVGLAVAGMLSVWGLPALWRLAPAFAALAFLMPVPGRIRTSIAIPLQRVSAEWTQWLLDGLGFAVERAGNVLHINGESVAVAEACNGMRMVSALLLVAYAFVFSSPMRWSGRILILAISPAVALLINVLRLSGTTLLYGYAEKDFAAGMHDLSGWLSLPLAMGIYWLIFALLRWLELPLARSPVWDDRPVRGRVLDAA
jgi:exosortase